MTCSCCAPTDRVFNRRHARRELRRYRKKGPTGTTRILIDGLRELGARGEHLFDVGGGVGAIHHELVNGAFARATHVDGSHAFLDVAREEAGHRNHADRVTFRFGDAVELAPSVDSAEAVTLDRVVCCYPDAAALVAATAGKATTWYALSFPRYRWPVRAGIGLINLGLWVARSSFRVFVRPDDEIHALVRRHGFTPAFDRRTLVWRVTIYRRTP